MLPRVICRSIAVTECPTGRTWCVTVAPARINLSASRRPSPGDLRLSFSPLMISTGVPSKRFGKSFANGESGRTRMAPANETWTGQE